MPVIKNEHIMLRLSTKGAEVKELQTVDGVEYIWQADPAYWSQSAPLLFPFIGRLTDNSYKYNGKVYSMGIHGFASSSEFSVAVLEKDRAVLELRANPKTKQNYPFDFLLRVTYTLVDVSVVVSYEVSNLDEKTMSFGIGGHPGFNVPLVSNESFEDYELEFNTPCQPDRVGFSPSVYLNGMDEPYQLSDAKRLPLCHDLFDNDAVILKNMAREIMLRSNKSGRGVCVSYPDMPYLGIWHRPKTDAPYVCIEPWSSLPAREGIVEEISCRSDYVHLQAGETYKIEWSITLF